MADYSNGDSMNGGQGDAKDDDTQRKIFVGGLSWETTETELRAYFEKFGQVTDCTLKTDQNTMRSRGFGFVTFGDASTVDQVVAQSDHTLQGKRIDPKRATARGGRFGKEPIKKVFVGGLDPNTPEAEIRAHFEQYGKIEDLSLPFDKMKNQRRGFCFITFDSEAGADAAAAQPKQRIGSNAQQESDVKKATPKNDQQGGFGGGRGGFGGRGGRGGRGRGGGGYNQGGYNGYDYSQGQPGYGAYDYNNYYNYDYNNYYNQGGWGGNQGYAGYGSGNQGYGGQSGQQSSGYHPYQR